jgi:hypothetical protein
VLIIFGGDILLYGRRQAETVGFAKRQEDILYPNTYEAMMEFSGNVTVDAPGERSVPTTRRLVNDVRGASLLPQDLTVALSWYHVGADSTVFSLLI